MAGRGGAAGLWALLLLLAVAGSGAAAPRDLGKVMSTQAELKMDILLLGRTCTHRHLLTPHLHRRCRQLVALVMCGRSLELPQVDLAPSNRWLRESVDALRWPPARGDGVYKSLLVWRARLLSSGSGAVICPTHQIKKLRRYFKKKDLQTRGKKWNEVGDGDGMLSPGSHRRGALRRRRDISSREAAAGSAEVDVSVQREAEQGISSNPVAGLHGGTTTQVPVGTRRPGPQVSGSDSPRSPVRRSGGGEGAGKGGSGTGVRGDTTGRGSGLGSQDPGQTRPHVSLHNHTTADPPSANDQGQGGGVGVQGAGGGEGLDQGPGRGERVGKGEGVGEGERVGEGVGERVGEGGNNTARTSPGAGAESGVAAGGEGAPRGGEEGLNTTVTARAPSSDLCMCGGAGAGVGVGMGGAVGGVGVGGSVPGAGVGEGVGVGGRLASSVPRARSEEAVWAAAALTVVLALLTVAVLYTRLYRRFIRSHSLYWTPVHCSTESVADIIKRRIVRFGKRKKRPSVKKKFSAPYTALPSEISD